MVIVITNLKYGFIDIDKFVEFTGMSDYNYAELKQTNIIKIDLEALEFKNLKIMIHLIQYYQVKYGQLIIKHNTLCFVFLRDP